MRKVSLPPTAHLIARWRQRRIVEHGIQDVAGSLRSVCHRYRDVPKRLHRILRLQTPQGASCDEIVCSNHKIVPTSQMCGQMASYQHAHRSWCPRCGADRIVTLNDGRRRAAKTGYYLPCGTWFQNLFKNEGLSKELKGGGSTRPPGHVSMSRGWHKKVHANDALHMRGRLLFTYVAFYGTFYVAFQKVNVAFSMTSRLFSYAAFLVAFYVAFRLRRTRVPVC